MNSRLNDFSQEEIFGLKKIRTLSQILRSTNLQPLTIAWTANYRLKSSFVTARGKFHRSGDSSDLF